MSDLMEARGTLDRPRQFSKKKATSRIGYVRKFSYLLALSLSLAANAQSSDSTQSTTSQRFHEAKNCWTGKATSAACGKSQSDLNENYFKATNEAAAEGDFDAQLCFARGLTGHHYNDVDRNDYETRAKQYIQKALDRGDWRAVGLVYTATDPGSHAAGMMRFLIGHSYITQYRMSKLMQLGATPQFSQALRNDLQKAPSKITNEELEKADAWATKEYRENFADSPQIDSIPNPCPIE